MLFPSGCIILSLCDHSGEWSKPYLEAGYDVRKLDLQAGDDVRLMRHIGPVYGVLAAPPCTMFCQGSAHLWRKRTDEQMIEALSVVDACLRIAAVSNPVFWAIENSAGQLSKWLGPPAFSFHPYYYGDDWKKLTHLWGKFNPPRPHGVLQVGKSGAIENAKSVNGSRMNARSVTPAGFARAFYQANSIRLTDNDGRA